MQNNKSGVKWMLMLDTEGLQSPERSDRSYDRKIILFAMLSADVLIINSGGDSITPLMLDSLKISCLNFPKINKYGKVPEVLYTFVKVSDRNK